MLVEASDAVSLTDMIGWIDGGEVAKAQRRRPAQNDIQVDYTLRWEADRLTVSLKNNRASDRNYVIYVVVEETLGTGRVLHTFEGIPVTGQLTYVPQSYFDEEFDALAKTAKLLAVPSGTPVAASATSTRVSRSAAASPIQAINPRDRAGIGLCSEPHGTAWLEVFVTIA